MKWSKSILIIAVILFASRVFALNTLNLAGKITNISVQGDVSTQSCMNGGIWTLWIGTTQLWMNSNTEIGKSLLSIALTAYSTGSMVRVYYYNDSDPAMYLCSPTNIPKILLIKFENP